MKVEIGESLVYSYLRHEKNCLITQTDWRPSGNWEIHQDIREHAQYEFDKINKHHAFSEIFKTDLNQTIKQAEIDVLGIDRNNNIYAYEVAFHENGLLYGGKIETRNRVFKKLLRSYLTLRCYFQDHKYTIAFCSPKVNPATEQHIKDYFEVLINDFRNDRVNFLYCSNEVFNSEIIQKTLNKTIGQFDSNELFARSVKLLNIADKFNQKKIHSAQIVSTTISSKEDSRKETEDIKPTEIDDIESVDLKDLNIPLNKNENETVQEYVKKIMRLLLNSNSLSDDVISKLKDKEYCKRTFSIGFPLIRDISEGYKDATGRGRYWSRETFGGRYYVCSQWWKDRHDEHLIKIRQWLISLNN